jgi:[acyl-carrier-protein] S-malonyltransferase
MAGAQPKLKRALDQLELREPAVPVISNVTAGPHESVGTIRDRLVDQVTSSVRWEESMRYLLGQGYTRFIELGPGSALSGFMKRINKDAQMLNISDAGSMEQAVKALSA